MTRVTAKSKQLFLTESSVVKEVFILLQTRQSGRRDTDNKRRGIDIFVLMVTFVRESDLNLIDQVNLRSMIYCTYYSHVFCSLHNV